MPTVRGEALSPRRAARLKKRATARARAVALADAKARSAAEAVSAAATAAAGAALAAAPHAPLHLFACGADVDTEPARPFPRAAPVDTAAHAGALAAALAQAVACACAGPGGGPHARVARHSAACTGEHQRVCRRLVEAVELLDGHESRLFARHRFAFAPQRGGEVVLCHLWWPTGAPERLHRQARLHFPHAWRYFHRFCGGC